MARQPDHPRSCGANSYKPRTMSSASGSSPLVRGQLGFERGLPAFGRIIPARAGPTTVDLLDARGKADHPRSCGANRHDQIVGILHGGSSPLVRGQHTPYIIGVNKKRIIPARAGPTARRAGESKEQADHPRSCGANFLQFGNDGFDLGSSPLVRGQQTFITRNLPVRRIIPARAGPTRWGRSRGRGTADHPRSCGANRPSSTASLSPLGSSPLVRGQRRPRRRYASRGRIIPARAGPTDGVVIATRRLSDHPRSCGANDGTSIGPYQNPGSSPLVRGQRDRHRILVVPVRIIPARAGPTLAGRHEARPEPDHPRSCGANC